MKITKSELKEMIREALREELATKPLKEAVERDYTVTYRLAGWPKATTDEAYITACSKAEAKESVIDWLLEDENLDEDDIKIIRVERDDYDD